MTQDSTRRRQAISLQEAAQASPTLAQLAVRARESSERLAAVQPLIPPALRASIVAGPVDEAGWCLLVRGSAAAAKLRQLLPALQAHLRSQGWATAAIRLRILQ